MDSILYIDNTNDVPENIKTSSRGHDVTGGIGKKIEVAVRIVASFKIPVYIVQAGTIHAEKALQGITPDVGTVFKFTKKLF